MIIKHNRKIVYYNSKSDNLYEMSLYGSEGRLVVAWTIVCGNHGSMRNSATVPWFQTPLPSQPKVIWAYATLNATGYTLMLH